jgi:hypothetical protein
MNDQQAQRGLLQLMQRLEPSLGQREPSFAEAKRIIEKHGLQDKTIKQLARMGFDTRNPA